MATIVGIRIKNSGKLFYFDPADTWPKEGDKVIVETSRGMVMGEVIMGLKKVPDESITIPLKPVLRIATTEDLMHQAENDKFAVEAFKQCKEKIMEHNLDMKLVSVEPMFDNSKIMFYFTASQRVDFRYLVKDLAAMFKTRIELRQIGVRDEAKILASMGMCGRPICCSKFLGDFQPVSIKMAKEQNLSLNPTKISGACGRLMCCLKFEQDYYEKMHKIMPKVGKSVTTPDGDGIVGDVNVICETVTVKLSKGDDEIEVKTYTLDQIFNPEKYKNKKTEKLSEFDIYIKKIRESKNSSNDNEIVNQKLIEEKSEQQNKAIETKNNLVNNVENNKNNKESKEKLETKKPNRRNVLQKSNTKNIEKPKNLEDKSAKKAPISIKKRRVKKNKTSQIDPSLNIINKPRNFAEIKKLQEMGRESKRPTEMAEKPVPKPIKHSKTNKIKTSVKHKKTRPSPNKRPEIK
ncbi:MAG: stage 0 sporulation family protein [Christensenellaceae bacterium]|nr:stage 0 sporulation family protein [Christensenellaceae bacterium]